MKEFVNLAEQSLKSFFKDKINLVLVMVFVGFALLGWCNFKLFEQLKINSEKITKVEKKVDFRYFNLTRSLEDIHSVKFETKEGRIIQRYNVIK